MAGTIKCGHCGKDHAEGTTFCPDTGKSLGPAAGAKKTMLMFQQPGARLPGSSAPRWHAPGSVHAAPHGPPPAPPGAPAGRTSARRRPRLWSERRLSSCPSRERGRPRPSGTRLGRRPRAQHPFGGRSRAQHPSSGVPTRSTPSGGVPVPGSSRPSRPSPDPHPHGLAQGGPAPARLQRRRAAAHHHAGPGRTDRGASGASGRRRTKSVPEWVAEPQAGSGGHIPSVMLPAVDAPPRAVMDLVKDAFNLYKRHLQVFPDHRRRAVRARGDRQLWNAGSIRAPLMVGASSAEASAQEIQRHGTGLRRSPGPRPGDAARRCRDSSAS